MISIIVPIYNSAKYLAQCIDSIICQSYTDWELILVDDGSKDQSGRICDEYAKQDHRITVIHQPNKGVSSARNVGIAIAKGEYLCFVDADDWLEPSFLIEFQFDRIGADFYIGGYIFNTYGTPFSYKKYEDIYCSGSLEISNEFLDRILKQTVILGENCINLLLFTRMIYSLMRNYLLMKTICLCFSIFY